MAKTATKRKPAKAVKRRTAPRRKAKVVSITKGRKTARKRNAGKPFQVVDPEQHFGTWRYSTQEAAANKARKLAAEYRKTVSLQRISKGDDFPKTIAYVHPNGELEVLNRENPHFPGRPGTGQRFAECVETMSERPGVYDPEGLCAVIGRRKYGAKGIARMAKRGRNPGPLQELYAKAEGGRKWNLVYVHDPSHVVAAKRVLEDEWETDVREAKAGSRKGVQGSSGPGRPARAALREFKERIEATAKRNPVTNPESGIEMIQPRQLRKGDVVENAFGRQSTVTEIKKGPVRRYGKTIIVHYDNTEPEEMDLADYPEPILARVRGGRSNPSPDTDESIAHGALEQHWAEHEAMGLTGQRNPRRDLASEYMNEKVSLGGIIVPRHVAYTVLKRDGIDGRRIDHWMFGQDRRRAELDQRDFDAVTVEEYDGIVPREENPGWFSRIMGAESRSPSSSLIAPISRDVLRAADAAGRSLGEHAYADNLNLNSNDLMNRARRWFADNYRAIPRGTSEREILNRYVSGFRTAMLDSYRAEVGGERQAPKSGKARRRRSNPEPAAAALSETFHGRPAETVTTFREEVREHEYLTGLGTLTEMEFRSESGREVALGFDADGPDPVELTVSEDGMQLYLVGGDQSVDLDSIGMGGRKWVRDSMVLGVLKKLTYRTQKDFDRFETIDYYHKLGEETKVRPRLLYDTLNKTLSIAGGQYRVERPGIIN